MMLRGDMEPLAQKKAQNFLEFQALYPEFDFVFVGDNGQGDARAVRSRRPAVLRCLHAVDATRDHLTMKWVVSFLILRPFGPRSTGDAPRRRN